MFWPSLRRGAAAVCLVGFLLLTVAAAQAPSDEALAPGGEERVITVEARQSVLNDLLAQVDQARVSGNLVGAAHLLNRVARLKFRLSAKEESLRFYREARDLLQQSPDPIVMAENLNGTARVLTDQEQCRAARQFTNRALSLSRDNGLVGTEADTLLTQSFCERRKDVALALATAKRSLELWQSITHQWGIAYAYQVIGEFQLTMNLLPEATESLEISRLSWRQLDLPVDEAESIIYLGFIEYRKGAWQNTIHRMVEAQGLLDTRAEPFKMGQITATLGEALLESGLAEDAIPRFQQTADYYRLANSTEGDITAQWDLGRAYLALDQLPDALTNLNSALNGADQNQLKTWSARSHEYLGRAYAAKDDQANALQHYRLATTAYEQAHLSMEFGRTTVLIGQVYQAQGAPDQARKKYLQALEIFNKLSDKLNVSAILYVMGTLELEQSRLDLAQEYLRRSLGDTESLRRNSTSADLTAAFSATVYERYEKYAECLMRQDQANPNAGYAARAFEISEKGRGRSLAELLRGTAASLVPGLDPELGARERVVWQLLNANANQQIALLGLRSYSNEELKRLKLEQTRLENEHRQATETIRQHYPSYGELTQPTGLTLQQIQDQVITDDQTVLLEYSLGDEKSYVWAVTRDGFASYELPEGDQINEVASRLSERVSSGAGANSESELEAARQELTRMILAPVAAELNKRRIIVVADRALNYISFQSLPDPSNPEQPLVDQYEVINAASASVLGALHHEAQARRPASKLIAAFGDPVFSANYAQAQRDGAGEDQPALNSLEADRGKHALRDIEFNDGKLDPGKVQPLFYARRELANLRSLAGSSDVLIASEFSANREQLLKTDLSQYAILHFATHGFLDPKQPENSGILLSTVDREGKTQNGFVGLQDIYSLRAPVDLVVLSACQTGLGKNVRGEGLIGLTRGFMYAGASTVIASLWKVDDKVTAELMKQFYANMLQNGMPPAKALQEAQITIRKKPQWHSPYYWAAFTIQGEFREPIRFTRPTGSHGLSRRLAVTAVILTLLSGASWWFRRNS
jgi:CHAT domain-containing protein